MEEKRTVPGLVRGEDGKWRVDREWLTPERREILRRLDERHEAARNR